MRGHVRHLIVLGKCYVDHEVDPAEISLGVQRTKGDEVDAVSASMYID